MDLTYYGHSCFGLSDGEAKLILDPFLKPNNPAATVTAEEVEATHVLVTHGHVDHIADAAPVAKATGAHVVAMVEVSKWLEGQGVETISDPNLGGTVRFDWGWVKLVQAFHTNTMPGDPDNPFSPEIGVVVGPPAGLVVQIGGKTVYHAGDTALFGDMELIARSTPLDIALIPIGGHYTMDRHDAVIAAELLGAETVIPIHFNTFPPIETDAAAFKAEVETKTKSKVIVMEPDQVESF